MADKKISVLLVDDHRLVRMGFRRIIEDEPDLEVVGEAGEADEAVRLALQLKPRVVVMDCALPGGSGIAATKKILETLPGMAVLMLSMHSEDTLVRQALAAGARGYILKSADRSGIACGHPPRSRGRESPRPATRKKRIPKRRTKRGPDAARIANPAKNRGRKIQQRNRRRTRPKREYRLSPPRQYHGRPRYPQNRRTGRLRHPQRPSERPVGAGVYDRPDVALGFSPLISRSRVQPSIFALLCPQPAENRLAATPNP